MKLIVLLGAPGAGKGTQAKRISEITGLRDMSTGEMLRREAQEDTPLGRTISETIGGGNLVPDELMVNLIRGCIKDGKCRRCQSPELCHAGFILDGFPRNITQAKALDAMVREQGRRVHHVILLDVDEKILKDRIESRARNSGDERRSDDTASTLLHRLSIYKSLTSPLIPYYEGQGILRRLDGMKPMDVVTQELTEIITSRRAA